jgi:peptide/nickel transport system substrate-binding protein
MSRLDELERLFTEGKISRRNFLANTAALGLTSLISPTLLAITSKASTPKRGGHFRIGASQGSISDILDPGLSVGRFTQLIQTGQIRNTLAEMDHHMQAVPELAESWEATPDAKQWVFKLRKGVEFHNGKTMDAEDVIHSINFHRTKDSKSAVKSLLGQIDTIKNDGKYTVIFSLKNGNADFPYLMTDYHLCIIPAGSNGLDGMGTGGYIIKNFEPGLRALTARNPNYFKENRAWFDEVETLVIADTGARMNALRTGQIDAMDKCDRKTFHFLEGKPGIQGMVTKSMEHYTFPMRCDAPPYDNNDVRLALKYAIDREHIVKIILRGYGYVGNDHPISPISRYHAPELPQRKYDPDKAKYHIKKAGQENAIFQLYASDAVFTGGVDAALLYKEHAAKAGIKIEVVRPPADGYWGEIWMKKPWCQSIWGGRPTEDLMFSTGYAADAVWNETAWKHPRFNELLVAARSELDEKKRRAMYVEMQQLVRDDGGALIPMFAHILNAATEKIGHGPLASDYPMDGWRCAERWWFV